MRQDHELKPHQRRTNAEHLAYEELAKVQFEPLHKTSLYRLVDNLRHIRLISPRDCDILKTILSASGHDHLCYCANKTLAMRVGIVNESQVSLSIRRLRDKGLITTHDSANCKRDKGFGLNIAILHVRHDELCEQIESQKQEMKDRLEQKRFYRSCLRKIQSFMAYEDLSDELVSYLYELHHQALDMINEHKEKSASLYRQAIEMIEAGLQSVQRKLEKFICTDKKSCLHNNLPMHIHNTNMNLPVFSNNKWQSANADLSKFSNDANRIEWAIKDKPEENFEQSKPLPNLARPIEAEIELGSLLHACLLSNAGASQL